MERCCICKCEVRTPGTVTWGKAPNSFCEECWKAVDRIAMFAPLPVHVHELLGLRYVPDLFGFYRKAS